MTGGWAADFVTRIVNVQWSGTQQAVIGMSAGGAASFLETLSGTNIGTGQQAASGLGITVTTDGYIAFGQDCFMASKDSLSPVLYKGTINKSGGVNWSVSYNAPDKIRGISFCSGAFFVTSIDSSGDHNVRVIARSADGKTWESFTFLSGADDCGSVALLERTLPNGSKKKIFCGVSPGPGPGANDPFEGAPGLYQVLYSSMSEDGMSWSTSVSANPFTTGIAPGVAAGNDIFVTGGFRYGQATDAEGNLRGTAAAQANKSSSGSAWEAINLAVPGGTVDNGSFGNAAVFEKNKEESESRFILAVSGSGAGMPAIIALASKDGASWSQVKSWGDAATGPVLTGISLVNTTLGRIIRFE